MRPVLVLSAILFLASGCDAFIPDVGGEGQECSTADTCKEGLTCRYGTCCRTHWVGPGCTTCPDKWDPEQDCNACLGNWDPEQDCDACLGNWDPAQNCDACLPHWQNNDDDCGTCEGNRDISQDCNGCLGNWDLAQDCNACLNQWQDNNDDCGTCPGNWDATQDCADCVGNWDPAQGCTVCQNQWVDNSDDCGTCPGNWDATQDCADCLGNWDPAQGCNACLNQWQDNNDDCGTCPGNWDATQDCAECVGNWDPAEDCTVCAGNWVDNNDDCGTCPGNWDPTQDCAACRTHWVDDGDNCGTCPPNWDAGQDCDACLAGWFGQRCEKVTDCTGQPDFTMCEVVTNPHDYYYDICVQGTCTSPGCDQQYCNAPGPHFTLADTNIRECYHNSGPIGSCPDTPGGADCENTPFCGQDAQYGWDAANPPENRFDRREDVTNQPIVVDMATGLVWQGCPNDFTGADCLGGTNTTRIWQQALDHCDGLDWGGFTDWHLPDEYELLSIVDYYSRVNGLAIDSNAFPQTPGEHFWTSSTAHGDQANAVAIEFGNGSMSADHKNGAYHTRCVRNGQQVTGGAVGARFTVDDTTVPDEPVVTDNVTGLDWQGCIDGQRGSDCLQGSATEHQWQGALARCQELVWRGYDDWYVPNIKQLQSITDNRRGNPALDTNIFPEPPADVCWSSTTIMGEMQKVWVVRFSERGLVTGADQNMKTDGRSLRCVRDGL
jgi:hypothetical protein